MKRCLNCMEEYEERYDVCPHCGYVEGTPPKEIYYLVPGTILNRRYIVGTVCGAGGFGIVYRAWDQNLGKVVAIKEYYPASLVGRTPGTRDVYIYAKKRSEEYRGGLERFLEEARNVAKFSSHPDIVNVYNFFEENGTAYFVMEFLRGVSYKEYIKQHGGIVSEEIAVRVTLSVLDALTDVHKAGIIHRDIAPDNVFILNNGVIKLNDFGAARFSDKENLTVVLKPGFAPAEQYQNQGKQGPYTDIYAVGAMLYRAVTGVMPQESTDRIKEERLVPPKKLNPEISENLNNVILRAMAMQPELRFQSTTEFKQALTTKKPVLNVENELKKRRKKRRLGMVMVAACLVLGGVGGFSAYADKKAQTELKPADIELWVAADEGETETIQKIYDDIVTGFRQDYPQVSVSVVVIPSGEYSEKIRMAIEQKELPDVFESSSLSLNELLAAADVDRVLEWVNMDEYYGLQRYSNSFGRHLRLPVSFYMPLLYVKGTDGEVDEEALQEAPEYSEEALNAFLSGETDFLLGDSSCYLQINSAMPARYHLQRIPDSLMMEGYYARSYSVSDQSSVKNKNAAYRFVYYLLSEDAQYELCIGSQEDVNNGIPLDKNSFDVWLSVNMEMSGKADTVPGLHYKEMK